MNIYKPILAVGSIALDTLETVHGNRNEILGGSATYFAAAAGLLAPVKLVGVVGNDFPQAGWDLFQSRSINTDNVLRQNGVTFRWGGRYSPDYSTRDTLFTELGVFENFQPEINETDKSTPLVFLGNIQPDLQSNVACETSTAEYIVMDTMNLWIDLFPEKLREVFGLAQILLINHEEAEQVTGKSDIGAAATALLDAGPEIVVIKQGADGAYLAQGDYRLSVPVYPVDKVIDPTGAGDSFAGGFMAYLSLHANPDFLDAVVFGSAMASFCVEGFSVEALMSATKENFYHRVATIKEALLEPNNG
jgi:sugar/nucleoside kinase (ribokinase family)